MRQTMCRLWTNFAKFHDPTPDHDHNLTVKWTPVQPMNSKRVYLNYLEINDELKMTRNLNNPRMDFWREVYRKWNGDFVKAKL
jgi:Carboxylesterase family